MTPAVHTQRRKILWTGGFDSTCLLLERLRDREPVEAVYLFQSHTWQKQINERAAKERIIHSIPKELRRYLVLAPELTDNALWQTMVREFDEELEGNVKCSRQLAAFASIAHHYGTVEGGFVSSDTDARENPEVIDAVFSRVGVEQPMIHLSKHDLIQRSIKHGYRDILDLTWSCETRAVNPKAPCGVCYPCKHRIIGATPFGTG